MIYLSNKHVVKCEVYKKNNENLPMTDGNSFLVRSFEMCTDSNLCTSISERELIESIDSKINIEIGNVLTYRTEVEEYTYKKIGIGEYTKLDNFSTRYIMTSPIIYLAHPLTSSGNIDENYRSEEECAKALEKMGFYNLIRPLKIIPKSADWHSSMEICKKLLMASTSLVLCDGWNNSAGCLSEAKMADDMLTHSFFLSHCSEQYVLSTLRGELVKRAFLDEES